MATATAIEPHSPDLRERNRRTVRVLLAIVVGLAAAALLVGIRW